MITTIKLPFPKPLTTELTLAPEVLIATGDSQPFGGGLAWLTDAPPRFSVTVVPTWDLFPLDGGSPRWSWTVATAQYATARIQSVQVPLLADAVARAERAIRSVLPDRFGPAVTRGLTLLGPGFAALPAGWNGVVNKGVPAAMKTFLAHDGDSQITVVLKGGLPPNGYGLDVGGPSRLIRPFRAIQTSGDRTPLDLCQEIEEVAHTVCQLAKAGGVVSNETLT